MGQSTTCTMSRKDNSHKDEADTHMMSGIAMITILYVQAYPSGLIEQRRFRSQSATLRHKGGEDTCLGRVPPVSTESHV